MRSTVYLGAPSQEKLQATWKDSFLLDEWMPLSQRADETAWRQLPDGQEDCYDVTFGTGPDRSYTSYLVPLNDQEDAREGKRAQVITDSFSTNATTSMLLTQMPDFRFLPAKMLDIEDVLHSPIYAPGIVAVNGEPVLAQYSFLAAILSPPQLEQKVTKWKPEGTPFARVLVGDTTVSGFEVACWGQYALTICQDCRVRDVLLFEHLSLSEFKGMVQAKTRQQKSRIAILYRVDALNKRDRRLQPTLLDDAQSRRVQEVRDWVIRWVPRDIGPPGDETQPLADTPDCTVDSTRTNASLSVKMPD